jgi:hypothetical protein
MPANAPVDPSATANTVTLLDYLWGLRLSGLGVAKCLTGGNLSIFDADYGWWYGLGPEYNLFTTTTGYSPAVLGCSALDNALYPSVTYDSYGRQVLNWALNHYALVEHARKGGIVSINHIFPTVPSTYATGSTAKITTQFGSTPQPISAITSATTLDVTSSGNFTAGGGNAVLVATPSGGVTTLYPFSYTSAASNVLHGVVFAAGVPSTAEVANLAAVYPAQLTTYNAALGASAEAGAWPLQYSSSAYTELGGTVAGCSYNDSTTITTSGSFYTMPVCLGDYVSGTGIPSGATVTAIASATSLTISSATTGGAESGQTLTFTCGQSTDWAGAQAVNANGNLNAMLDYLITELNDLGNIGIPVLLRFLPEMNGSSFWWAVSSPRKAYWFARLFAYCVGYITGTQVFTGQPVSATPAHNVLFVHNILAVANLAQWNTPSVGGTVYADIVSCDFYDSSTVATMLSDVSGYTGYSNCPQAAAELFGGTAAEEVVFGGITTSGDLSLLGSGSTLSVSSVTGTPASSGTLLVPCVNGLQSVTYSSYASNVFTLSSTSGVPSGSFILPSPALLTSATGVTNLGASTLLSDIDSTSAAWYGCWDGGNNQLYVGSYATLSNNAWMINREQMPVMPWALPGNFASGGEHGGSVGTNRGGFASWNFAPGPGR